MDKRKSVQKLVDEASNIERLEFDVVADALWRLALSAGGHLGLSAEEVLRAAITDSGGVKSQQDFWTRLAKRAHIEWGRSR
jgi:hypothetical protein